MIFNIFRIFPIKSNRVSLITTKSSSFESNLHFIEDELKARETSDGKGYECRYIPKDSLSFSHMKYFASSKYVFLTDNFFPLAFMNTEGMKLIQLWHGTGTFKKFGYDLLNQEEKKVMDMFSDKIDLVTVSSENAVDIYARNFHIDKSKVKPFGVPRNDFYDDEHLDDAYLSQLRADFERDYPQIAGKKLVLYAPTFRESPKNNAVFDYFDIESFINELGEEYCLAIRLHPNYKKYCDEEHNIDLEELAAKWDIIDFTGYKDEQKLLLMSDILIADYSSIMVDYTILNKPIILFAYDLDDYLNKERGFYFDYKEKVPGKIVYDADELIQTIKENDFDMEKLEEFSKLQFGDFKADSSKRILDYILDE